MRGWALAPDGAENRRHERRVELNLSAELRAAGHVHPTVIQNLSRFGARVCGAALLCVSTPVELVIVRDGRSPVVIAGVVVYRIDEANAARLHTLAGLGIRFDDAVTHDPSTFAALIDGLHTAPAQLPARRLRLPRFATRSTQPMAIPLLAHLVDSTQGTLDDHPRFAGTLSELSVPTLLMMLEQGRKSGQLELACAHLRATIEVVAGQIVEARCSLPGCTTDEILMFVLDWNEGSFELVRASGTDLGARPHAPIPITRLLLEHARIRDEAARQARRSAMPTRRTRPVVG